MTVEADDQVRIGMLGRFRVSMGEEEIEADRLGRRAAELVQLLALADRRRLTRDQVVETLWPHLEVDAGGANLRKAAHRARRELGDPKAVVLAGGQVALFPSRSVATDVAAFESGARDALAAEDKVRCDRAASAYPGDLLPEALYERWTQEPRERLRAKYVELLGAAGRWERLVEVDPANEAAYLELIRSELSTGSRAAAIRWFGRLRTSLQRELGISPSSEAIALYDECIAGLAGDQPEIIGRQLELAKITAALRSAEGPDMVVLQGSAGLGKSALCSEFERQAVAEGWFTVSVGATEAGGAYSPLTAAIEQVVRRDRALLDAISEPARSLLAELTPLAAPATPLESPITRHRVIGALGRILRAAAGDSRSF